MSAVDRNLVLKKVRPAPAVFDRGKFAAADPELRCGLTPKTAVAPSYTCRRTAADRAPARRNVTALLMGDPSSRRVRMGGGDD